MDLFIMTNNVNVMRWEGTKTIPEGKFLDRGAKMGKVWSGKILQKKE